MLKSSLRLEACQVGDKRSRAALGHPAPGAQEHHIALGLGAYLIVERERLDRGLTWRHLQRRLSLKGGQVSLPALERVREAA